MYHAHIVLLKSQQVINPFMDFIGRYSRVLWVEKAHYRVLPIAHLYALPFDIGFPTVYFVVVQYSYYKL